MGFRCLTWMVGFVVAQLAAELPEVLMHQHVGLEASLGLVGLAALVAGPRLSAGQLVNVPDVKLNGLLK